MGECKVEFYPDRKVVNVKKGQTLLEAANLAGIYVNSLCGGEGICGRCRLILREGKVSMPPTSLLTWEDVQRSYVLACLAVVESDIKVELPVETRMEDAQILTETERRRPGARLPDAEDAVGKEFLARESLYPFDPMSTKIFLDMPPPSLDDNLSDLQRVLRELKKKDQTRSIYTRLARVKPLARILRDANWKVTVTLAKLNGVLEMLDLEPRDTSRRNFGLAVDIGTTTVVAMLVNLQTGEILATKACPNSQMRYGEDVISRIIFASEPGGVRVLHRAVVEDINGLVSILLSETGVRFDEISSIVCAGNTTMIHLLLDLDPEHIRREPYIPTISFPPVVRAAELGIRINPGGILTCVPGVSSYVGGDIVAGVLASGMAESQDISIFLDIGTNGEVVVGNKEWLVCCSCSAGPAFEGGGIRWGMRASKGAIQEMKFRLDEDRIEYEVIGNVPPRGICGSGLIDTLAEMMRWKIVDRAGKIRKEISSARLREGEEGMEFLLLRAEGQHRGSDIVITDTDIENLIRAKGAIYVGCDFLLRKMGVEWKDIKNFYIAGGFGNYLNMENAVIIGLLPDIPREKFEFIGNGSLTGAKMILISSKAHKKAEEIAERMTNFELSVEPSFMNEYTSSLFLPHTDLRLFPSVARMLDLGVI